MVAMLSGLAALVTVLVQFVIFLRWLHRRMRDDEVMRICVRDVAMVHLPHIYKVLNEIAENHGIAVNAPPVQFVDFHHGRKRA